MRAQVPHRGGDRLHVSVKKFNRGVNAALGRLQKTTGAGWHTIQSSINTTIVRWFCFSVPYFPCSAFYLCSSVLGSESVGSESRHLRLSRNFGPCFLGEHCVKEVCWYSGALYIRIQCHFVTIVVQCRRTCVKVGGKLFLTPGAGWRGSPT